MRLVTITHGDGTAAGVLNGDKVAVIGGYDDVGALLADGDRGLEAARDSSGEGAHTHDFDEAMLRRPILSPGAVVCVGLNYATHIREMGRDLPTTPTLFSKLPRALTDPFAAIPHPGISDQLDYEGELCVVIGRPGRNIAAADAWDHVGGLTLMNDVTVRDYQWRTPQWFAGKTWEASTPIGPVVVTPDELGDVGRLELVTRVDGEERQRASIGDLVFDVPHLVEDVSKIVTLQPGDLIATGTPGGVGAAMDPKGFLAVGSVVEVEIEGIGSLRNRVEARS
jgi:acylpyruvate hydrolase